MTRFILDYETPQSRLRRTHSVIGLVSIWMPVIAVLAVGITALRWISPDWLPWDLVPALAFPIVAVCEATVRKKRLLLPLLALGISAIIVWMTLPRLER